MQDKIDITMTSVIRPSMIDETLSLIVERVCQDKKDRFNLILNVDPVGENKNPEEVVNVAKKYFPSVIYNISKEPSFPKAVKWVWNKSTAPYVFHWEDDVNILFKIDIDEMIEIHKKYSDISSLRLFVREVPKSNIINVFRATWTYQNDGLYIADRWEEQFGLNPILIKKEFVKEAVKIMVDDINPEKQFRYKIDWMVPLISKWKYALYTKPGWPRTVDGRKGEKWKQKFGFKKPKGRTFTKWKK